MREFIYGWDFTEFDDNDNVYMHDTFEEAQHSLREMVADMNTAYTNGDMDEPYQGDCEIHIVDQELMEKIDDYER